MKVTRRTFVKATGVGTIALSVGGTGLGMKTFEALAAPAIETKQSFCDNPCSHHCSVLARTSSGRIIDVHGVESDPYTEGRLCAKPHAATAETNSPQRILSPMRRVGDTWVRTDWDTALDEIAARLIELRQPWMARGGLSTQTVDEKKLVAMYTTPRVRSEGLALLYRFRKAYGARPHFGGCQSCGGNFLRAAKSLFGNMSRTNTDLGLSQAADYIVLWGSNWAKTMPVAFQHVQAARARGAKAVCIDVRKTNTANHVDEFVGVRPGADGALALGLIHVLLNYKDGGAGPVLRETGDPDPDLTFPRVSDCVVAGDLDKLRTLVAPYTPSAVSETTWVPADVILRLAYEMATSGGRNTSFIMGSSISSSVNGYQTNRAIMLLPVLLGAFGVPGGGLHAKPGMVGVMQLPTCGSQQEWWRFGTGVIDDLYNPGDQAPHETYEDMVAGKVKVLFSNGSLVASRPNTHGLKAGLERMKADGLIVHMGMFEDECAEYAHFILPLASEFEEAGSNLFSGATNTLRWKDKVVDPLGEARSTAWIWNQIGHRVFKDESCTETTFTGEMAGRDNPEYLQPLWPYSTFGGDTPAGFDAETTFTYFRDISYMMMNNMLMMQGATPEQAAQRNPYGRLTLANVKTASPTGGILFPAPLMGPPTGMPFLYMNSADPGRPLFNTPDKLVHIDIGAGWHNGGLPDFVDTHEAPDDRTASVDWSGEYPLYMITAKQSGASMLWASRWDGVTPEISGDYRVEINPATAEHIGVDDAGMVRVETPRGSITMRVRITETVPAKLVMVPAGTGFRSPCCPGAIDTANVLTSDVGDPHTEIPGYRTAKCRLTALA